MTTNAETADKMLDKAANMAEQIAGKMAALAEKYGPDVVNAGLAVIRIDGAQSLVVGFVLLGVVVTICVLGYKHAKRGHVKRAEKVIDMDTFGFGYIFPVTAGGVLAFFMALGCADRLFSIWNWVQVFYPELYIAKRIIEAGVGRI